MSRKGKEKERNILGGYPSKGYKDISLYLLLIYGSITLLSKFIKQFFLIHTLEKVPYCSVNFSVLRTV